MTKPFLRGPFPILLLWIGFLLGANLSAQPTVSSVQAQQRSGTKLVDITYNLAISGGGTATVTVKASKDGGQTFVAVPEISLTGAFGANQAAGNAKSIVWDAGAIGWEAALYPSAQVEISATAAVTPTRVISLSGDLAYGNVTVGQSATRTLTISNTGNSALTVSSISYPAGFSGAWSGTVSAGGNQSVTVTFAPVAAQAYSGNLTVNSDATSGTNTRAISGTGVSGGGVTPAGIVLVQGGTLPAASELAGTAVSSFYIGRYEVTWGEWQGVRTWAAANGYDIGTRGAGCADTHPVRSVAWYDVVKWCNARSQKEGLTPVYTVSGATYKSGEPSHTTITQNLSASGYRLPTEAEWEFAARGGNQTHGYTYSGSNDLNTVGWYGDNSGGAACDLLSGKGTWPVGQKSANELGLHDMSGNVWEWCWDVYDSSNRRVCGGSFFDYASVCTVSIPHSFNPARRIASHGVRLALSSVP